MGCGGEVNLDVQTYIPSGASKDSVDMTAATGGGGCWDDSSDVPGGRGRYVVAGKAIGYAILGQVAAMLLENQR
jgi:hypothetical protein